MDVSRIEAYNPNKINWRNMTAKEILKYEKQGVEVPDVYVQWAHNFLQNIQKYDNDEVTYEKAKSSVRYENNKQNNDNLATSNLSQNEIENQENKEATEIENFENNPNPDGTPEVKTLTAKEKLEEMKANGDSKIKIAETFKDISNENKGKSFSAAATSEETSSNSNDDIQILNSYMSDLMTQIQEVKSQIQSLKGKKDDSNIGKINQLRNEITKLGEVGQSDLLSYRNDFDQFDLIINDQLDIGAESIDYGNTTIETGKEIIGYNFGIQARKTIKAGDGAVKAGNEAQDKSNEANSLNSDNKSEASSYAGKIMAETGVGEAENEEGNNQEEKYKQDPITGKEKEADKDVKTASNDGTDTTDKLHISIDELVKRKVRRGEYIKDA